LTVGIREPTPHHWRYLMARRYKPIQLDVKPVAGAYLDEAATCPQCSSRITEVLGRMGLRLVFRCDRCRVQFFRQRAATSVSFV
jgi:hypothetical protein